VQSPESFLRQGVRPCLVDLWDMFGTDDIVERLSISTYLKNHILWNRYIASDTEKGLVWNEKAWKDLLRDYDEECEDWESLRVQRSERDWYMVE